jgi:phospholipid/cholesterol/gamma-HCH transport system ATP-binding protein
MISIKGLKKRFGNKEILKGINLDIKEGETTVIFGLSGGGKSTIIKHIAGLLKPDDGAIFVDGVDITKVSPKILQEMRKNIGFLFQSGALFDSMNVYENVAFPLREHTYMSEKEIRSKVMHSLDMVALSPDRVMSLFPDELSGGMRKRVGLARTIIMDPKYILYDEPTSGLDPVTSDQISQMMIFLQNEIKATSVLISHDIKESFKVANSIAMLYQGEIIEHNTTEFFQTTQNEIIRQFCDSRSDGPIVVR